MYCVDNAIIMAAGTSSRFAPLSYERPKALIDVNGEVLIERQIKQIMEVGISEIIIVVGYMKESFDYLIDKFGVKLVENKDYMTRNNNSSIFAVKDYLKNSYVCSADNYFAENPFETEVPEAYYAGVYTKEYTNEWCVEEDEEGYISNVTIGGNNSWYMLGHTFWSEPFSQKFISILEEVYFNTETADLLWEDIFRNHLNDLKMKVRKYGAGIIYEFDTLNELREFDKSYVSDTRSDIIKSIAAQLGCLQDEIKNVDSLCGKNNMAVGFCFTVDRIHYEYQYATKRIIMR